MADWKNLEAAAPLPPRGAILVIANQKGGVGKTTTAVNLAAALAQRGHRVLTVDLDPQGNLTTGLGLERPAEASSYELILGGAGVGDVVRPTQVEGLWCVPASLDLAGAEVELVGVHEREQRLRAALRDHGFDVAFVDCPPSLGLLTVNALTAAQRVIVPVQCEYYALEGLGQLLANAARVKRGLNPRLALGGLVLTMYDGRTRLSEDVAAQVRAHFGEVTFRTVIPRTVRLSEAPSFGEPVVTLDPSSRGAIAFRLLAAEFEERRLVPRIAAKPSEPAEGDTEAPSPLPGEPNAGRLGPQGYGTVAPQPPGLDAEFPRAQPWTATG